MSDIDFQNGLVVGMTLAGKNGLVGKLTELGSGPVYLDFSDYEVLGISLYLADSPAPIYIDPSTIVVL